MIRKTYTSDSQIDTILEMKKKNNKNTEIQFKDYGYHISTQIGIDLFSIISYMLKESH